MGGWVFGVHICALRFYGSGDSCWSGEISGPQGGEIMGPQGRILGVSILNQSSATWAQILTQPMAKL